MEGTQKKENADYFSGRDRARGGGQGGKNRKLASIHAKYAGHHWELVGKNCKK